VFGIIGSYVLLGGRLGLLQWLGAVMILSAALIVLQRQAKPA
jgi:drug/metabolite transporter (DMT)-like permease